MAKIKRPRGLIRYSSLDELEGKPFVPLYKRPRVIVYFSIMLLAIAGIIYGIATLGTLELKVLHERQPLFVTQSDGSIQNRYELKILNKTNKDIQVSLNVSGHDNIKITGVDDALSVPHGKVSAYTIFIRIPGDTLKTERIPVTIRVEDATNPAFYAEYKSMFFGPKH
jgi:polyferredoxin